MQLGNKLGLRRKFEPALDLGLDGPLSPHVGGAPRANG